MVYGLPGLFGTVVRVFCAGGGGGGGGKELEWTTKIRQQTVILNIESLIIL